MIKPVDDLLAYKYILLYLYPQYCGLLVKRGRSNQLMYLQSYIMLTEDDAFHI